MIINQKLTEEQERIILDFYGEDVENITWQGAKYCFELFVEIAVQNRIKEAMKDKEIIDDLNKSIFGEDYEKGSGRKLPSW